MASRVKSRTNVGSPADLLMDEAIELAIKGRSPYPMRATFLNHDAPELGKGIARAFEDDRAVVLVWPDGSSRVLEPSAQTPAPERSAALNDSGSGIDLPAS